MVLNADGKIESTYNKTHLFDADFGGNDSLKESNWIQPGSKVTPPVQTPVGNVGLAIVSFYLIPH